MTDDTKIEIDLGKLKSKLRKFKLPKKYGFIFLIIILTCSSLTAFMTTSSTASLSTKLIVKFSNYESYSLDVSVDDNTTLLKALSVNYYVRLENDSIVCIRNSCNINGSNWLAFNSDGYLIKPEAYIVSNGETLYMIYNKTASSNDDKDTEAIRDLLLLD